MGERRKHGLHESLLGLWRRFSHWSRRFGKRSVGRLLDGRVRRLLGRLWRCRAGSLKHYCRLCPSNDVPFNASGAHRGSDLARCSMRSDRNERENGTETVPGNISFGGVSHPAAMRDVSDCAETCSDAGTAGKFHTSRHGMCPLRLRNGPTSPSCKRRGRRCEEEMGK